MSTRNANLLAVKGPEVWRDYPVRNRNEAIELLTWLKANDLKGLAIEEIHYIDCQRRESKIWKYWPNNHTWERQ